MGQAGTFNARCAQVEPPKVRRAKVTIGEVHVLRIQLTQIQPSEIPAAHINGPLRTFLIETGDIVLVQQRVQRRIKQLWAAQGASPVGFMTPL